MTRHARARWSRALILVAVTALPSCARAFANYDLAPGGLSRAEHAYRTRLVLGHADSALFSLDTDARPERNTYRPGDELLRSLYTGVLAHYAGRWELSARALDRAALLSEDRVTHSISRNALSVVSSDGVLEYVPSRTERLLIHYYAALDFARQGSLEAAAVEARRLSHLLQQIDDTPGDISLRVFLRYFAGTIFEAAGARNDADVAYRNASLHGPSLPADTSPIADSGMVVLLVERGFVAHKVEEGIVVALDGREVRALTGEDAGDRAHVAGAIAERVLQHMSQTAGYGRRSRILFVDLPPRHERYRHEEDTSCDCEDAGNAEEQEKEKSKKDDDDDDNPYLMKLSWPGLEQGRTDYSQLSVMIDSARVQPAVSANVSDAVAADFDRQRAAVLARTILRGATKLAITRTVEKSAGKQEALGRVLGALTNMGGVLTERADTRSWHLLPGAVEIVRLRAPAGARTVTVEMSDGYGTVRTIQVPVEVRAGRVAFASTRIWQ